MAFGGKPSYPNYLRVVTHPGRIVYGAAYQKHSKKWGTLHSFLHQDVHAISNNTAHWSTTATIPLNRQLSLTGEVGVSHNGTLASTWGFGPSYHRSFLDLSLLYYHTTSGYSQPGTSVRRPQHELSTRWRWRPLRFANLYGSVQARHNPKSLLESNSLRSTAGLSINLPHAPALTAQFGSTQPELIARSDTQDWNYQLRMAKSLRSYHVAYSRYFWVFGKQGHAKQQVEFFRFSPRSCDLGLRLSNSRASAQNHLEDSYEAIGELRGSLSEYVNAEITVGVHHKRFGDISRTQTSIETSTSVQLPSGFLLNCNAHYRRGWGGQALARDHTRVNLRVTRQFAWLDRNESDEQRPNMTRASAQNNRTGTVEGIVYVDQNQDGIHSTGEPVVSWAIVSLDGAIQAITDDNGRYQFPQVPSGQHRLHTPLEGLPPEYQPTSVQTFTLAQAQTLRLDLPVAEFSSVQGRVFRDANQNGLLDSGESGIPNVLLTDGRRTTSTDANGEFRFDGLDHGSYILRLDTNTLPARAQVDSTTLVLDVSQGTRFTEVLFPVQIAQRPVVEYEF